MHGGSRVEAVPGAAGVLKLAGDQSVKTDPSVEDTEQVGSVNSNERGTALEDVSTAL
jgi:hypothetical protein